MTRHEACGAEWPVGRNFCPGCGKADLGALRSVTVQGRFKGPANVSSSSVEKFWNTGDPSVFQKPGQAVGPLTGRPI